MPTADSITTRLGGSLALLAVSTLTGCWTASAAAPDRTARASDISAANAAIDAIRWPDRTHDPLVAFRDAAADGGLLVVAREPDDDAASADDGDPGAFRPKDRLLYNELAGEGLLRVYDESGDHQDGFLEDYILGFDTDADFMSSWYLEARVGRPASDGEDEATEPPRIRLREGVRLGLPPVSDTPPRGLLIHLPALVGTSFEAAVVEQFEDAGWAVLHLRPFMKVRNDGEHFVVSDAPDGPEQAGVRIAAEVDQMFADAAYAAESAVIWLREHRPDIPTDPIAILGFSGGSFSIPAIATRLAPDIDAAITIGGGAGIVDIARRSTLTDVGVRFRTPDGRGLPPSVHARIAAAYDASTRLAPVALAPALRTLPVLQVDGRFDLIVPARNADRLHRLLGDPERLRFAGGHRGLFYVMPARAARFIAWLERTVAHVPATYAASTKPNSTKPNATKQASTNAGESHRPESNR